MTSSTILRTTAVLLNIAIVFFTVAIIALIVTGGYRIDLFGLTLSSNRIDPLVTGLLAASIPRLALHLGAANFTLFVVSCLFAAGLGEAFLRTTAPAIAEPGLKQIHRVSDTYEFELVPGSTGRGMFGEDISINLQGARDAPFTKKHASKRIVAVGDSFTFGIGVELDDTYVKQLEQMLRNAGNNVEVLNLGVGSYNFWQYLEVLERKATALLPDLVLIGFFLDDLSAPTRPENLVGYNPFERRVADDFTASALWNAIGNLWTQLDARYRYRRGHEYLIGIEERKRYIGVQKPNHIYYRVQTGSMDDALYESFSEAVDRLAVWSVRENVPVVVVFIPDASQLHEPQRQSVNRTVKAEMTRAGIPFVDATPLFEAQPDARPLYLFPLDAHISPSGHRLIAEVLAQHAIVKKLLEAPSI